MIFFKKSYASPSNLQIEDYIPLPVFQSLLPKHQQFLEKLFHDPCSHFEKFLSKISSNGVIVSHEMLQRMIEEIFIQNQIPFQSLSNDSAQQFAMTELRHQYPKPFKFWIKILQELKIWKNISVDENTIYQFLNIIDKLISSNIEPYVSNEENQTPLWKKDISLPEATTFKFLFDNFKYFHAEDSIQAKRPMDLYELYCLFEDAVLSKNLIKTSPDHQEFLRVLHGSALIFSALKLFPAAFPDFLAFYMDSKDPPRFKEIDFFSDENYESYFGRHPHLLPFNTLGFYMAFNTWIEDLLYFQKKNYVWNTQQDMLDWLKEALFDENLHLQNIQNFQNISKRLIFIFNRLTISGFLLRSPVLKGLGYHPLMHTEIPIKFLENYPLFLTHFKSLSVQEKDDFLINVLAFSNKCSQLSSYLAQQNQIRGFGQSI